MVCVCVCTWDYLSCCSGTIQPVFFMTESLPDLELNHQARLDASESQGSLNVSPTLGYSSLHLTAFLFLWVLETDSWSAGFYSNNLPTGFSSQSSSYLHLFYFFSISYTGFKGWLC